MIRQNKCEDCDYVPHHCDDVMLYCNKCKAKVYRYSNPCRFFQTYYEPF